MTLILSNLPEEYHTIVEILEYDLDDEDDPLTIERIRDKLSVKFDQITEKPGPRTSREYEKSPLRKIPIQGYLHHLREIRAQRKILQAE